MITNFKKVKSKLESKNIKPTFQRLKVLEYLEKNRSHPTADNIYSDLSETIPTLSKTTVYNTLNYFIKKGLVLPIAITCGEMRFDGCTVPHHHFYCQMCKKIIDLNIRCSHFEKGSIKGHRIQELHGYFKGICRDCLEK